uniref:Triple functional domain protein n=1 Tax=Schistocephalus solidus TaxID=70667 RepID=A0A0X3PU00_SCHSO
MDYSSKHIAPEVLDFYRPNHLSGNRSSNSSHPCHPHLQRVDENSHFSHQNLAMMHMKNTNVPHTHPGVTSSVHPGHTSSSVTYQQARQFSQHVQPTNRSQAHAEGYRHHQQTAGHHNCPVGASGRTPSASTVSTSGISSTGSGHGSSSSNCKSLQKSVSSSTSLRAAELIPLLRKKIAMLPGGRTRTGGPILCFPANTHADELPLEDLYLLVRYLTYLPDDNVKKLGFTVIIDMRSGTTWHSVKPILRVIEECIGGNVAVAYIIKPDKFFEKQKAQMALGKYSFETQLVSVESLFNEVDPSQLTADLEGSLPYSHSEWIQIRCCLEDFFMFAHDMSDKFGQLYCFLDRKQNPETVEESKRSLEEHRSLRLKVMQAPVPALEAESDRLTAWLRYGLAATSSAGGTSQGVLPSCVSGATGSGASYVPSSWVSMNPDFQQLIPQVRQTVSQLYEFRAHLQQKWESTRTRLEQIYQLRLFEDDASRMANWLEQQRHIFLSECTEIGSTAAQATELHSQHRQFLQKCAGVREQVSRLTGVAVMLADTGHFASQQILKQANQLEHERKAFTAALDERSRVLQLSTSFHTGAETFFKNLPSWEASLSHINGANVSDLNQALKNVQDWWQEIQRAYEEACIDGRALTKQVSVPVSNGSHNSLTATIDYSQCRKHCTELLHKLWDCFKRLERAVIDRRRRLTSRLALLMFKEDVGQVLAWLTDHGEPFLARQTAVGKSSQRAEQLYNAHMQFEQVAANTLTNADKLISAADELASQAENPQEILNEANELQRRITTFTNAVDTRREMLDLACGFYGHAKEVLTCLHGFSESYNPGEHFPPNIEGVEDELTNFHQDRSSLEAAIEQVNAEGNVLIGRLQDTDEVTHLRSILHQVASEKAAAWSLLTERQLRLDLCMQLRLFEADVHQSLEKLRREVPAIAFATSSTPSSTTVGTAGASESGSTTSATSASTPQQELSWVVDPRLAPSIAALEEVNTSCLNALPTVEEVLNKGSELFRAFESVGVNFPAGGPGSSDSGVGDSSETAFERLQRLIAELADSVNVVDDISERVSGELDWRRLQLQSYQVLQWISQCENVLYQTSVIPTSLSEAEALKTDHENFQPVLNEAHPQAVQCAARASYLLQLVGSDHPRRSDLQSVAETVANRWQKLVYAAEEQHKLLLAATNWYKTSEQVISVLRSLEKEYRRDKDWCHSEKAMSSGNIKIYLDHQLSKHGEQKEAFLKACILARRTSDLFVKYLHRQPPTTEGRADVEERIRTAMAELMTKEQAVLEAWAAQRRRLDDCVNYICFERDIRDLASRILQSVSSGTPADVDATNEPLPSLTPQSPLYGEVKRTCHKLSVLIEMGGLHVPYLTALHTRLQTCITPPSRPSATSAAVGDTSESSLIAKMRTTSIGGSNRTSVSSTGSYGSGTATSTSEDTATAAVTVALTEEQRKQISRRENLLRELVATERSYVVALRTCLETFRVGTFNPPVGTHVPASVVGKEAIVFGNLAEICDYHEKIFEPELCKYAGGGDFLPEDVGHCFVSHGDRLAELYVDYCVNKVDSTQILIEDTDNFFQRLQIHYDLSEPLQSFLIKPVQRITKYQLLLRELRDCCDKSSAGELNEGLEVMLAVPKKANEAIHLRMLQGLPDDLPVSALGDVIVQDQFTVWEPKQLIKKGRERRVFLFDFCLVLAKECPVAPGDHKMKYQFKSRVLLADLNITEHIEGDQCKFALWTGRVPPVNDGRLVFKAQNLEVKQTWVRAIREAMRERMFSVQSLHQDHLTARPGDAASLTPDTFYILENYQAQGPHEISVSAHQIVQLLQRTDSPKIPCSDENTPTPSEEEAASDITSNESQWALVRFVVTGSASSPRSPVSEGFIPARLLGAPVFQQRASSVGPSSTGGGGGTRRRSGRKWLPSSGFKDRRGTAPTPTNGTISAAKRGSRTDMPIVQAISATLEQPLAATDIIPTVGQLEAAGVALLDNVSEESVELELPPPMVELQALPTATSCCETETEAEETTSLSDEVRLQLNPVGASTLNVSTLTELHTANFELNLSTTVEVVDSEQSALNCVPVLMGVPSDVKLGQLRLHGALRVATRLVGAPRGSDPGPASSPTAATSAKTTGCAAASSDLAAATTAPSLQDEELLRAVVEESTDLVFVNRHLMLFERGLVIADEAVETTAPDGGPRQLRCQFRHFISFAQAAILEDISAGGSHPTGDHVLWFCVSERPRRALSATTGGTAATIQSHLCHILAPPSVEVRLRWLTELNSLVQENKRLSIASEDVCFVVDPVDAVIVPSPIANQR